jgi:hypothetical protein
VSVSRATRIGVLDKAVEVAIVPIGNCRPRGGYSLKYQRVTSYDLLRFQHASSKGQIFDLSQVLLHPREVSHAGVAMRSGPSSQLQPYANHAVVIIGAVRGAQQGGA